MLINYFKPCNTNQQDSEKDPTKPLIKICIQIYNFVKQINDDDWSN